MTRYARAKGSKASNERIPEPATPWSEMKQQLLEKKKEEDSKEKREEINAQRLDSYKKFLDEHETKESKKTKWAEFPGVKKPEKDSKLKKKKIIEKLRKGADAFINGNDGTNKVGKKNKNKELDRIVDEEFNKLKVKLDKILDEDEFRNEIQDTDNDPPEEVSSKVELPEIKAKKAKQKKLKVLSNPEKGLTKGESNEIIDRHIGKGMTESETNQQKKKKKKLKMSSNTEQELNEQGESKNSSNDISDRQIGKETTEPETYQEKKKKKKKLTILNNTKKELNERDSENSSNEMSHRQIGEETTESETNQENKKKKKRKMPLLEEKSCTQVEEGPIKKKSKKSSKNDQTSKNEELEKAHIKNKSKVTSAKKENKSQISKGNIKDINNTEENAEILKIKLARKERKKKRQWERRQLKKAQKQAEKESQNTDAVSGIDKNSSDQQNFLKNQKQSNGHPNKNFINDNEINNFKDKSKFAKNQNQLHNNINKHVSKENKIKTKLDGADGATAAKNKKNKDEKTRRKPLGPEIMTINGQNVEIELVDGFPVKKEDAVRLKQLRKQMISKGLPRSEIDKALKLERRKAEKALARLKRVVCFNCRKTGHNLSECPEVGKDELAPSMAVDICFKCGSTEHKSYECKVVRGDNFKHATCFICKEQGHISRQCPDNPRGLYPKGGACKVCGDVTHLKKDCPQYQAHQQQQGGVKVDVINESNPDDLGEGNDKTIVKKRVNKIIKF